ncbi:MAG: hypothetical protein WBV46_13700, partial [Terriglobales bacterium]
HPRRFAWGSLLVFLVIPTPRCTVVYGPNNGLTAAVNMNVLDSRLLLPFTDSQAAIGMTRQCRNTVLEIVGVRQYARERIGLWRKRWESFGKYLIIVSMILLVVFVYCTGLFWSAWQALRDVEKGQT